MAVTLLNSQSLFICSLNRKLHKTKYLNLLNGVILLNDTLYFSGVGTLVAICGQSQDLSAASGPRTHPSQSCRESNRGSLILPGADCQWLFWNAEGVLRPLLLLLLMHWPLLVPCIISTASDILCCHHKCARLYVFFGDLATENKFPSSQASMMARLHSVVIGITERSLRTHWYYGFIYLESFWISFSRSKYLF